jgi:probable HAF family extracellular repeat protein
MMRSPAVLFAFFVLSIDAGWAKPPPRYTLHDLGTLPGDVNSYARRINDRNQIIGGSETAEVEDRIRHRAFFWENGIMKDLGTLPGRENSAADEINNRGQILGSFPGAYAPMNIPAGYVYTYLSSLNDLGVIAGTLRRFVGSPGGFDTPFDTPFVYDGESITLLPAFIPGGQSRAVAINNCGQLLLFAEVSAREFHPVLYSRSETIDLTTVPGVPMTGVRALNNTGHVLGSTIVLNHDPNGFGTSEHPSLYGDGRVSDLGLLPKTFTGEPLALNDRDEVVGMCFQAEPGDSVACGIAFLFSGDEMYELQRLVSSTHGWSFQVALDINNHSWIVGAATRHAVAHAILLEPVHP